jgi:hypothetical protein
MDVRASHEAEALLRESNVRESCEGDHIQHLRNFEFANLPIPVRPPHNRSILPVIETCIANVRVRPWAPTRDVYYYGV